MGRMKAWLTGRGRVSAWTDTSYRASSFGNVIADKPSSITINRAATQLAAQTVRLDLVSGSTQEGTLVGGIGTAYRQRVLVTGYRNHPTERDLDIQVEDTFLYEEQFYRVVKVEPTLPDRVLAVAEADG